MHRQCQAVRFGCQVLSRCGRGLALTALTGLTALTALTGVSRVSSLPTAPRPGSPTSDVIQPFAKMINRYQQDYPLVSFANQTWLAGQSPNIPNNSTEVLYNGKIIYELGTSIAKLLSIAKDSYTNIQDPQPRGWKSPPWLSFPFRAPHKSRVKLLPRHPSRLFLKLPQQLIPRFLSPFDTP